MKAVLLEMEKQPFGKQLDPEQTVVSRSCQVPGTTLSPDPGGPGDGARRGPGPLSTLFQALKGWSGSRLKWKAGCLLFLKNNQPEVTLAREMPFGVADFASLHTTPSAPHDPLFVSQKKANVYLNSFPSVQDAEVNSLGSIFSLTPCPQPLQRLVTSRCWSLPACSRFLIHQPTATGSSPLPPTASSSSLFRHRSSDWAGSPLPCWPPASF